MHTPKELELHNEIVRITWRACERCCAAGPRSMTLVRGHYECTIGFDARCCTHAGEEELECDELFGVDTSPSLRRPARR